ncbi:MAG: PQQ-binding-like beta-propeller repeat protein [Myxococcota bacterium]
MTLCFWGPAAGLIALLGAAPPGDLATSEAQRQQYWGARYIVDLGRFEFLKINREEWSRPYIDEQSSHVYLGLRSERLEARRLGSGEVIWSRPEFGEVGAEMSEVGGLLLVGQGPRLVALDKYTGREKWAVDVGGTPSGGVAMMNDIAVVPARPNAFVGLSISAEGASVLWRQKRPTPDGLTIRGQAGAYIHPGLELAVLGFSDGTLLGVELQSGDVRWLVRLGEPAEQFQDIDATPLPVGPNGGEILTASFNKGVYRLSVEDGSIVYMRSLKNVHGLVRAEPLETIVFSTGRGDVLGFDPDLGRVTWSLNVKDGFPTRPSAAGDGHVWVGTSRGSIHLLDARTGKPLQALSPGSGVSTAPFVRGSNAVLLSNKGMAMILAKGHSQNLSGTLPVDRGPKVVSPEP